MKQKLTFFKSDLKFRSESILMENGCLQSVTLPSKCHHLSENSYFILSLSVPQRLNEKNLQNQGVGEISEFGGPGA